MIKLRKLLIEEKIELDSKFLRQLKKAIEHLKTKSKVLLLTTSNRRELSSKDGQDVPKSTRIANVIQRTLGESKCTLVDVSKLIIHNCEGNVSSKDGNNCGVKAAMLKDKEKNPSGNLRCWASVNNDDDELWKVSGPLLDCETVVFLGSIRWGQTNSIYQKLIERLNWIENRHTTLGEKNIVKDIESGLIFIGHNWNGSEIVKLQKEVHIFYGFKPIDSLYFNYQFTNDSNDESKAGYLKDVHSLDSIINLKSI